LLLEGGRNFVEEFQVYLVGASSSPKADVGNLLIIVCQSRIYNSFSVPTTYVPISLFVKP